jgi:hypothetical protein
VGVNGRIDAGGDKDIFKVMPDRTGNLAVRLGNLALGTQPLIRLLSADGNTVLGQYTIQADSSDYFHILIRVQQSQPFYIEISDQDTNASGGLYSVSAGAPFPNENFPIFLPNIRR